EPCEEKFSRTVLESGGARESVADFNLLIMIRYLHSAKNPKGGFQLANELSVVCTEQLKVG
ncbi:hypothetical protein, partial [Microcoleus sp. T3_B1]|uniref:hypothetical protein n=1 Tax=Microcoleus sp. T3_B1 TaxID=3055425 RepID=UPI002FD53399